MGAVYESISTDWSEDNASEFYGKAGYGLREQAFLMVKQLARVAKKSPAVLKIKSRGNINFVREPNELIPAAFESDCDVRHIGVELTFSSYVWRLDSVWGNSSVIDVGLLSPESDRLFL